MGQAASPSLYDYAGGDPVNFFDPTGRCPNGSSLDTFNLNFHFIPNPGEPTNWGQNPADPGSQGYRAEFIIGGSGTPKDSFPYANTTDADCGIAAIRNIETLETGKPAASRTSIITQIGANEAPGTFDQGGAGMQHTQTDLNAALNPTGYQASRTQVEDSSGFVTLLSQGNVMAVGTQNGDHIIVVEPQGPDYKTVNVYNNGPTTQDGHATVQTMSASDASGLPQPQSTSGTTSHIWVITKK